MRKVYIVPHWNKGDSIRIFQNSVTCASNGAHLVSFSVCYKNRAYTSNSPNEKAKTIIAFLFHFSLLNKGETREFKINCERQASTGKVNEKLL